MVLHVHAEHISAAICSPPGHAKIKQPQPLRLAESNQVTSRHLLLLAASPEAAKAHHGRHVRVLELHFLLLILLLLLGQPLRLLFLSLSSLFVVLQEEGRAGGWGGVRGGGDKLSRRASKTSNVLAYNDTNQCNPSMYPFWQFGCPGLARQSAGTSGGEKTKSPAAPRHGAARTALLLWEPPASARNNRGGEGAMPTKRLPAGGCLADFRLES